MREPDRIIRLQTVLVKVGVRSRDDYEWAMDQVCNTLTKKSDRIGDRLVKTIPAPPTSSTISSSSARRASALGRAKSWSCSAARLGACTGPKPTIRIEHHKTAQIVVSARR